MICSVCPNCGYWMEALQPLRIGKLFVEKGGAHVRWDGRPVPLTASERIIVATLAHADGCTVGYGALADAFGSESDDPHHCASVLICRIRCKIQAIDPDFDALETVWGKGFRWRP